MHEQLPGGVYRVELPLPFPSLDHVNSYVFNGEKGWYIVDAGVNSPETRRVWKEFMAAVGLDPREIKGIYVTHSHPDHYGAAGWLQHLSGAPVYMSALDFENVKNFSRLQEQDTRPMENFYAKNGVPSSLARELVSDLLTIFPYFFPCSRVITLREGDRVALGDREYTAIWTPGHSEGHLCFFNREQGLLLSGDHLLLRITSHVGVHWNSFSSNPLHNYLNSLRKVRGLPVRRVLPAHGPAFTWARERISEIEKHHRARLAQVHELAENFATPYEISREIFGGDLPPSEIRLAVAETLAHLNYMKGNEASVP